MRVCVMGVTGAGKSTVGRHLAQHLGVEFADGDDFHSAAAIAAMAAGTPLTDEDRRPWLDSISTWLAAREGAVVACSALSRGSRDVIRARVPDAVFVHLHASRAVIEARVRRRSRRGEHFAGAALLDGQYRDLEALGPGETGLSIDVSAVDPEAAAGIAFRVLARGS